MKPLLFAGQLARERPARDASRLIAIGGRNRLPQSPMRFLDGDETR
jgi:hypothetical protein